MITEKLPSMRPPPGEMPDFINPYSLDKWVITCTAVCLFSTTLFVGARMYTKAAVTKSLDWADCELLLLLHECVDPAVSKAR